MKFLKKTVAGIFLLFAFSSGVAQRQMEYLNRGVYAQKTDNGKVFVSWRLLANEPDGIAFNIYRTTLGKTIKLNAAPLTKGTNFTDETVDTTKQSTYSVKTIVKGKEQNCDKDFNWSPSSKPYLSIPLRTPAGYTPNDVSVGDVDGDGEYEIIVHQTGRGKDNSLHRRRCSAIGRSPVPTSTSGL